jgi:hypothetical protein
MNIKKEQLIGISPNSKIYKEYKKNLKSLTNKQKEILIGTLLGDASLQTQNNGKTYRIKFEQGIKHKLYLEHIYNDLFDWIISKPHEKCRINKNGNLVINYGLQTISHEVFNEFSELFLINNKKCVSNNLIKDYLTPIGLAYWYMDDGGKLDYNKNSKNKDLVLNTQSFSISEVEDMALELNKKFELNTQVRNNKGKKIIVIKENSYDNFIELTNKYIIESMKYKLP